ncbi:MAG: bacterial Ig-like domain-containing protein [Eubacteriales bacterium]
MKLNNRKNKLIITLCVVLGILLVVIIAGLVILSAINAPTQSNPQDIRSINISALPSKVEYYIGESFDPTGMQIQVITNDMAYTRLVDSPQLTFSGFDSTVATESQVITVSYKGFTTVFTIVIKEFIETDPELAYIEVQNFKNTYTFDEWNKNGPDKKGATIKCVYTDGSVSEVPLEYSYILGATKLDEPGTTTIIIKYSDRGVSKEQTVTITITE